MADTVTPIRELKSKSGMGIVGWIVFLGMLILLFPLIPFYILLKLYEYATGNRLPELSPDDHPAA